jgi:hypothetical protein
LEIGFLERYRATEVALQAYVAGLPLWVNVWRAWMFFIFTAGILFVLRKPEARWLALTMVVSLVAYNLVSMASGVGRFPSIAFVLLWSPLALYLARRRPHLPATQTFDRIYAWWVTVALATLCVSLAFDVYNVAYSFVAGVP